MTKLTPIRMPASNRAINLSDVFTAGRSLALDPDDADLLNDVAELLGYCAIPVEHETANDKREKDELDSNYIRERQDDTQTGKSTKRERKTGSSSSTSNKKKKRRNPYRNHELRLIEAQKAKTNNHLPESVVEAKSFSLDTQMSMDFEHNIPPLDSDNRVKNAMQEALSESYFTRRLDIDLLVTHLATVRLKSPLPKEEIKRYLPQNQIKYFQTHESIPSTLGSPVPGLFTRNQQSLPTLSSQEFQEESTDSIGHSLPNLNTIHEKAVILSSDLGYSWQSSFWDIEKYEWETFFEEISQLSKRLIIITPFVIKRPAYFPNWVRLIARSNESIERAYDEIEFRRLAEHLAPFMFTTPAVFRALRQRLFPSSDLKLEVDFLESKYVSSHNPAVITLEKEEHKKLLANSRTSSSREQVISVHQAIRKQFPASNVVYEQEKMIRHFMKGQLDKMQITLLKVIKTVLVNDDKKGLDNTVSSHDWITGFQFCIERLPIKKSSFEAIKWLEILASTRTGVGFNHGLIDKIETSQSHWTLPEQTAIVSLSYTEYGIVLKEGEPFSDSAVQIQVPDTPYLPLELRLGRTKPVNITLLKGQEKTIERYSKHLKVKALNGTSFYFKPVRNLSQETAQLNEAKVILLGNGGAGKTSLLKKLTQRAFNPNELQTHGIRIQKHQMEKEGQDFFVHFWDFGGQEVMHATHQFFLTRRCLYLLVLDSRKEEKAEYWLNCVKSFAGNAPVIVVLNKMDENPSFDINRQFLKKKYANITHFSKVSCQSNEGIDALREKIMDELWGLEYRKTVLPANWLRIKQVLESMAEDYIGYDDYVKICEENLITERDSQKVLLELLNDLGIVLSYEKLRLHNTQVLNPLWLTRAVYRIINSPIVAFTNGRFHLSDLDAIINDPRYHKDNPEHVKNVEEGWTPEADRFPEDKFLFIIAMMEQFELLYQVEKDRYVIPAILPQQQNTITLNRSSKVLSFVMEYEEFMPASIIPRLMVKMHKYVFKERIWKTGMVLEEKFIFKSKANIVLDQEKRTLYIDIQGRRNRDFLTMIRETVRDINDDYEDLQVTEWIPLPEKHRGETPLVDYHELLGYEKTGQENYFSGKLRRAFSIEELLNGIERPGLRNYMKPLHVFISHSHKDAEYKERLKTCLMPLVRLNKAVLWDDAGIDAGSEWNEEIFSQLERADIVLCIISADFIASDFCYSKELGAALEAHKKGKKMVVPIMARETNWDGLEIAELQGLPSKWISQDLDHDKSWAEVSKGIEKVINKLQKG